MAKKITCPSCEHVFRTNGAEEFMCPECGYSPEQEEMVSPFLGEGEEEK